jgi:hypothetical protein
VRALGHAGLALLCLLVGAACGLAAVAVHHEPWGWPLGVAAAVAGALALPPTWWGRLAFCLGWAGAVFRLSLARAEGDYLVGADLRGYGLLGAALVLALVGVVGLARGRAHADPRGEGSRTVG